MGVAVPAFELWCPLPRRVSPHLDEVVAHSAEWLIASGMVACQARLDQLCDARTGGLAAWTYPDVDLEMLMLVSEWLTWLFALDDTYCEGEFGRQPGRMVRMSAALANMLDPGSAPLADSGRCAQPLRELTVRISRHASHNQLARWESTVRDYLYAQVWEATNREADVVPALADYLFMRRYSGATLTAFALIDVLARIEVPPHEADSPPVRRLNQVASDIVSWDNDIYSHAKERAAGDARHNIITVLAAHHRCPDQEAFGYAVQLRDEAVLELLQLVNTLKRGSAQLQRYATGICSWVRGHIDWTIGNSRFVPTTVSGPVP